MIVGIRTSKILNYAKDYDKIEYMWCHLYKLWQIHD